jgi:biopolymer transport protein ExbD
MRRRRRRNAEQAGELNIMPFMNLMVILLPFLLVTAVFSRTAVLELNLPGPSTTEQTQADLALEITVRDDAIEIGDRATGLLTALANGADGYDLAGLSDYLVRIKARFPEKVDATVLVEPDVSYDAVVHVMDTVRSVRVTENGVSVAAELFPEISIGDAVADGPLAAAENPISP